MDLDVIKNHLEKTAKTQSLTSEDISSALAFLARLPQRHIIPTERAIARIESVLSASPDELLFYLKRLSGWGGSDVGALLEKDFFSSATQKVMHALMMIDPEPQTVDTRRGRRMESVARQFFLQDMAEAGVNVSPMLHEKAHIEDSSNPVFPWMRSTLDDLYKVDGETWLVDFKCLRSQRLKSIFGSARTAADACHDMQISHAGDLFYPSAENRLRNGYLSGCPFQGMVAQLHSYYRDATLKGVHVDRMMLACFDYEEGARCTLIEVQLDPALIDQIESIGSYYWDEYVMKGQVPDYDVREYYEVGEIPAAILEAADNLAYFKLLTSTLSDYHDTAQAVIRQWAENTLNLGDGMTVKIGLVDLKAKRVLDQSKVHARLLELGMSEDDIDGLRLPSTYADNKRVRAAADAVFNLAARLKHSVESGDREALVNTFAEIRKLDLSMGRREKGGFDPEKLEAALLKCNESMSWYFTEEFSANTTRASTADKDLLLDSVKSIVSGILPTTSSDNSPDDAIILDRKHTL